MLKKIYHNFSKRSEEDGSGLKLGLFRFFYSMILAREVYHLIVFEHFIFDYSPFGGSIDISIGPLLIFWQIITLFLILGLFYRAAAVANYACTLLTFSTFRGFEYHWDYAMIGINFLLIFFPANRRFSFDSLIKKIKLPFWEKVNVSQPPFTISPILSDVLVFFGVGLVYFDSVFYKVNSPMWMHGLGMWLPASIPQASWNDLSFLLDNEWVVRSLGMVTLIFEATFIFLMWFKRLYAPLLIIGVSLHLGILLAFPIPMFALGAICLYIFLIPDRWLKIVGRMLRAKSPHLIVFYDSNHIWCVRIIRFLGHFDLHHTLEFNDFEDDQKDALVAQDKSGKQYKNFDAFIKAIKQIWFLYPLGILLSISFVKKKGEHVFVNINKHSVDNITASYQIPSNARALESQNAIFPLAFRKSVLKFLVLVFFIYASTVQAIIISPRIGRTMANHFGFSKNLEKQTQISLPYHKQIRRITGQTAHPVFMDNHFSGYSKIFTLSYKNRKGEEKFIPFYDQVGTPSGINEGRFWVYWTFRVNRPKTNLETFMRRMQRTAIYWLRSQNLKLREVELNIYMREIRLPNFKKWEENYRQQALQAPWKKVGTAKWRRGKFRLVR